MARTISCSARRNGIDPVFAVDGDGKYRDDWGWLGGQGWVINAKFNAPDGPICTDLREAGALLAASADFKHSYPHCWRSKAKVIFRCTPQWFIPMDRPLDDGERRSAGTTRAARPGRPTLRHCAARDPAGCPKRAATGSARWSRAAPTG